MKGDITVIMIGYYDSDLRKIDGVWKLTRLDVLVVARVRATACTSRRSALQAQLLSFALRVLREQ